MPLTKKEREEREKLEASLAAARDRIKEAQALRWSQPGPLARVRRDLPAPTNSIMGDHRTFGWDFNAYDRSVYKAWSDSVRHGTGHEPYQPHESASQGGRALFSTERLALCALRHALECEYAKHLAGIDSRLARIDAEAGARAERDRVFLEAGDAPPAAEPDVELPPEER